MIKLDNLIYVGYLTIYLSLSHSHTTLNEGSLIPFTTLTSFYIHFLFIINTMMVKYYLDTTIMTDIDFHAKEKLDQEAKIRTDTEFQGGMKLRAKVHI